MTSTEDALFALAVILAAIGGLIGIAYSLDVRREKHGPIGPRLRPPGAVGRACWWIARVLAVLMLLSVLLAYALHVPELAWAALGLLALFFIDHVLYRVIRLTGK
jgi:hypothetical protein